MFRQNVNILSVHAVLFSSLLVSTIHNVYTISLTLCYFCNIYLIFSLMSMLFVSVTATLAVRRSGIALLSIDIVIIHRLRLKVAKSAAS